MDKSIILKDGFGIEFEVWVDELVDIYYEFDKKWGSDEYVEVIIKYFRVLKYFVTQKCGGEMENFDTLEYVDYIRSDQLFELIQESCTCVEEIYVMIEDIIDPAANMFEILELVDGNYKIYNINSNQVECIDNIVNFFCMYMKENGYV